MKRVFDVPEGKKIRLILDSDAKNEADDQYALVHALLTPKFDIKGMIGAHFYACSFSREDQPRKETMLQSYNEIKKLLELMDWEEPVPVLKGAEWPLDDATTPQPSEGAEWIVKEAMKDDPRPLYVAFLGTQTDLASAYLMEPAIAGRLTALWIGGGAYPEGGQEFNVSTDYHAANVVFSSPIPLWQIPRNVYSKMRVSLAELMVKVKPCGAIGEYLVQQLVDFNNFHGNRPRWPRGESWSLGDSPVVALLMDDHEYGYTMMDAPRIRPDFRYAPGNAPRQIRVYHEVDSRFLLEDLFAKLRLHYGK